MQPSTQLRVVHGTGGIGTSRPEEVVTTALSLAEQLLLVALDDEKGTDTANWGGGVEAGLGGALLLELAAAGCIVEVLVNGREPTGDEVMLISLLRAYDLVKRIVPKPDRRAAQKRAKELSEGDAIGAAVGSAISDIQAATMAAVMAATTATTISATGGSGGS